MRICDAALCRYRRPADFFGKKPYLLRATRSLADLNYADDGGTTFAVVLPRGWARAAIARSFVLASISICCVDIDVWLSVPDSVLTAVESAFGLSAFSSSRMFKRMTSVSRS